VPSTIYDIRLQYSLDDKASSGTKNLERRMVRLSKSSGLLGGTFTRLGLALGGVFGARAGAKALVGFNATMEQARITMGGMIQLTTKGDWQQSLREAGDLVGRLQQRAKASVGTTQDMVDMSTRITRPVLAAGLGMKDLEDFTVGAVVASRAMGIEAGMAARDIESALMGQLRSVDRFARNLLEPLGFVGDEGRRRFNEMGAAARAAQLKAALTSDAIRNMANAQENSFSGVFSTLQDNLQIFLGGVGLPLFKAITDEIRSWNQWIDKNQDTLRQWAQNFKEAIMSGFQFVKSTVSFIVRHRETILQLIKAFVAFKLAQKGLEGAANLGTLFAQIQKEGVGLAMKLNLAAVALAAFAFAAQKIADKILADQEKTIQRQVDTATLRDRAARVSTVNMLSKQQEAVTGGPGGDVALRRKMRARNVRDLGFFAEQAGIKQAGGKITGLAGAFGTSQSKLEEFRRARGNEVYNVVAGTGLNVSDFQEILRIEQALLKTRALSLREQEKGLVAANKLAASMEQTMISALQAAGVIPTAPMLDGVGPGDNATKSPKVNVTINRIEVQSNDPDRWVFDMQSAVGRVARNPTSAHRLRRGLAGGGMA